MANDSQRDASAAAVQTAPELGLLRFQGPDAAKFLQGQLSNDMSALSSAHFTLAGLHNPQGRVLALLRLAALAPDHIVALLPTDLAETTAATLRRFVLRAKVTLTNESTSAGAMAKLAAQLPSVVQLLRSEAHALNIAVGVPQVYAATSGEFVAQMLNLDCVNAISFNKGCYTGQEIIARAHYRGRLKRRMQRFITDAVSTFVLAPGQPLSLGDGRSAKLVDGVRHADGRLEFLAVAALTASTSEVPALGDAPAGLRLACTQLPLPYALPD